MPYDFQKEEDVKEFLDNLGIEYRFECFKERKPDGCHRLGDYLEAIKKDFVRACNVYKNNCDNYHHGKSCFKYANYRLVGKGPMQACYKEKVGMCDGVNPYHLHISEDASSDTEVLPATTYADIINYLVLSMSYVTLNEMKAYKSLEVHNYITSIWVRSITVKRMPSGLIIVLGEVSHSQRLREAPLKSWCLAEADGPVITCTAGAGEACSDVSAILFAVETSVRLRDARICTEKENAWLPASSPGTEYKDIEFSSSKMKKRKMDNIHLQVNDAEVPARSAQPQSSSTVDKVEAQRYYHRGCEAGCARACFGVGLGLTSTDSGLAQDVTEGLAFFTRACDMGAADGCYFASSLYITGKEELPRDMRRAFEFAVRACDLKNMQACSNVALMYARGHGVKKDASKAERYRAIVSDYNEQLKQSRGIEMEQGIRD
ncbi:hypothetical protein HPB50_013587 [Hyalomma asiaticum]|uniref:Uncharacterized protein n=1 Tax=Hyalomma asiaticum TaxID=266040 RepID=A0ACB7T4Q3_HYAAI|nr:hypothetical protein HPB50_013587 [Hyalomma asiaticum]